MLRFIFCFLLLINCSPIKRINTEYKIYQHPVSAYKNVDFLGIGKNATLTDDQIKILVEQLATCNQFKKVSVLDHKFSIDGDKKAVAKLAKQIKEFKDSRYVHGVLVAQRVTESVQEKQNSAFLIDLVPNNEYKWYPGYGFEPLSLPSQHELYEVGPVVETRAKRVKIDSKHFNTTYRFILFNKRLKKKILDESIAIKYRFSSYKSKNISEDAIKKEIDTFLLKRIARKVCPVIAEVKREIVASNQESEADILTLQGLEYAGENNWEKAADAWRKAILDDKDHPYAHHNLGIYFERNGKIPEAMEEFYKSSISKNFVSSELPRQYDMSIDNFLPGYESFINFPQILRITSANWVIINSYGFELNYQQKLPVFRIRRLLGGKDLHTTGVEISEVGNVQIMKPLEGDLYLGHIQQYVAPGRILPGDMLMVKSAD